MEVRFSQIQSPLCLYVGFTKYDDTAAQASNSIQESELKSIRDFLDSVDLRCVFVFVRICLICML